MSPLALSVRFLQTQPDRRLIELARAGHERAFEALVQRYRKALLRYCRRLSPSEASGEDALQQALMQAWVALANPEIEVRDARAWLYRIVHNVAISQLRRPVHDSLDVEDGGQAGGAEDELEQRLDVRAALAGLASLPELQRRVMLSTAFEGRSHDEVADALGLSHGAVRGLIYRARATLRAAAAAVTPSPLIHWAVRQGGGSGRSAAVVEAVAGSGSVGIGSLLVKGGAVVAAAGAIATATGISGHTSPSLASSGGGRLGSERARSRQRYVASKRGDDRRLWIGNGRWVGWRRLGRCDAGRAALPRIEVRRRRVRSRLGLWGPGLGRIRWWVGPASCPWVGRPERARHRRRFRRVWRWQRLGVAAR